jgi:hypothetical protein
LDSLLAQDGLACAGMPSGDRVRDYTGRLTAELAAAKNIDIVLTGRNMSALSELGDCQTSREIQG